LRRTDPTYRAVSACWRRTGQRRACCPTTGDDEDIDRS